MKTTTLFDLVVLFESDLLFNQQPFFMEGTKTEHRELVDVYRTHVRASLVRLLAWDISDHCTQ